MASWKVYGSQHQAQNLEQCTKNNLVLSPSNQKDEFLPSIVFYEGLVRIFLLQIGLHTGQGGRGKGHAAAPPPGNYSAACIPTRGRQQV